MIVGVHEDMTDGRDLRAFAAARIGREFIHGEIGGWLADHPWAGIIVHQEPESGRDRLDGSPRNPAPGGR